MLRKYFFVFLLVSSSFCFSQGWDPEPADPGFGGGGGDPATEPIATPVDGVEIPLLITAIVVALIIIKRKHKSI